MVLDKPCNKVTDQDIIGVYMSLNQKNKNRQYLETFENGKLYMVYCDGNIVYKEWGTWKKMDGCRVVFNGLRIFNTGVEMDSIPSSAYFNWIGGKVPLGDDDWSFQKVRNKPKLVCEE
jgi:hypothetical protein